MTQCLSVVCNVRIVAKRCVLPKNCLKKQIGLPDRYPVVPLRTPTILHFPQIDVLTASINICMAN